MQRAVPQLGFWRSGDVIGQCLSHINPFQVECLTKVEVSRLPDLCSPSREVLLSQLYQAQKLLQIARHKRVELRLAEFLDWMAEQFSRQLPQGCLVELPLTHQDVAEVLGATRVTVTRLLTQFKQDGRLS